MLSFETVESGDWRWCGEAYANKGVKMTGHEDILIQYFKSAYQLGRDSKCEQNIRLLGTVPPKRI